MFFVLASAFMFACSDDDSVPNVQEGAKGSVTFEISAVNDLNTGVTRGPVYSQAPDQHVTRVSVYAFKSDGSQYLYTKTYDITGWTDGTTFKRYEVPVSDNLPAGDYKFMAIGRDASDQYTVTAPTATTTFEDMAASVTASGNETEIFAGSTAITIASGGGSRVSIPMTRNVAGILGYFKNIPQTLNGTTVQYLRLSVTATNTAVNLSTNMGSVAGTTPFNLIDIDLSTQAVNGGVYAGNDLAGQGVVKLDNSQLGGAFIIPVTGVQLTLGLYDSVNGAIKTWVVKDSSDGSGTFNVTANHFYSLGTKNQAGNTNGGTGGVPGDDDVAIDLLTDQNIVVTINPSWDTIHNLIIQ